MFKGNLLFLRKRNGMTQEDLADKLGVSRQTVAKWELGGSLPDIKEGKLLANIFNITLDHLVNFQMENSDVLVPSKSKYLFGVVSVGEDGQISIPIRARNILKINSGDRLIVFGDESHGLSIVKENDWITFSEHIMK